MEVMKTNGITPADLLDRHVLGDWGDVCDEDKGLNDDAVQHGDRILRRNTVGKSKLWVITEGDRSSTCICCPANTNHSAEKY